MVVPTTITQRQIFQGRITPTVWQLLMPAICAIGNGRLQLKAHLLH